MKKRMKTVLALVFAMIMAVTLASCTAVQVSSTLVLNADGSGSRKLEGYIAKQDHQDGYGSAYYYFKQHGADLENYIKAVYSEKVAGSDEWLSVSVDDSGSEWEVVTLDFSFSSFEDYTSKLQALCYDETMKAVFADPVFGEDSNGMSVYTESTGLMTSIFKSLQNTIMADEAIYDPASTKDGVALNDGSADGQIEEYGVELMKPDFGAALTVELNGGEPTAVEAVDGFFTISRSAAGEDVVEEKETSRVLYYSFNDTLDNEGTMLDSNLAFGEVSTGGGPVFEDGINGKAIKLDGATYLASPNKSYNFKEMTISFYYRMDSYTQTDTGANMIVVPAGLGALSPGVIDIEFLKDGDAEGIQLLSKMNSSDWQTQDKLYSEGYLMESHMSEWHNYTLVYQNDYDENGAINESYVFMYIDGKLATRSRLSVAAGLTYSLGSYDDGSIGEPNGGFNIGGYFENETVKRASTGLLDEFVVYDGALSEAEIQELIYTAKVDKEYDPDVVDTVDSTEENKSADPASEASNESNTNTSNTGNNSNTNTNTQNESNSNNGGNNTLIVVIVIGVVIAVAGIIFVVLRKKAK